MEPNEWKVVPFADVGWEVWMRDVLDLRNLVDAGAIVGPEGEKAKEAITAILVDGLIPAFMELRKIRDPKTDSLPILNRQQPYEDFARKL